MLVVFDSLYVTTIVISIGLVEILEYNFKFSFTMKQTAENYLDQLSAFFYTCSIYCTIVLTIVRYIAICHTCKADLVEKTKIIVYLGFVILFSLIWNLPKWFRPEKTEGSSQAQEFDAFEVVYMVWGHFTMHYLIPLVILITLNILMLRKVSKVLLIKR